MRCVGLGKVQENSFKGSAFLSETDLRWPNRLLTGQTAGWKSRLAHHSSPFIEILVINARVGGVGRRLGIGNQLKMVSLSYLSAAGQPHSVPNVAGSGGEGAEERRAAVLGVEDLHPQPRHPGGQRHVPRMQATAGGKGFKWGRWQGGIRMYGYIDLSQTHATDGGGGGAVRGGGEEQTGVIGKISELRCLLSRYH